MKPAPRYASATDTHAHGTIPLTWHGAASVLPVLRSTATRLLVRVAQRPNGQKAWISSDDATLSRTPYEIVIHLHSTHLTLFRRGKQILSAPIGVGTTRNPTPKGAFFVAFFATAPSSGYGPFVMVTSAHSKTITDWEQSGDGMIGIHGPLGEDAEIGTTGTRVSHGCIRMHVADLRSSARCRRARPSTSFLGTRFRFGEALEPVVGERFPLARVVHERAPLRADVVARVEEADADAADFARLRVLAPQRPAAVRAEAFRPAVARRLYSRISSSPASRRNEPGAMRACADAAVPVRRWQRVQWQ